MAEAQGQKAKRVLLVTGANRGIGLAVVRRLATLHPRDVVLLAARSQASLDAALAELAEVRAASDVRPLLLDVTDDSSIAEAVKSVAAQFDGRLDGLINNAGIAILPKPEDAPEQTRAAWAQTLDTNVASVAALSEAFRPLLARAPAPRIVNVSSGRASLHRSSTGDMPPTASISYSVSKAALNMLTVEQGKRYAQDGIAVLCVNPGHCATRFNGFRGTRDVGDGARCVVDVLDGDERQGFWEAKEDGGALSQAAW